MRDGEFLRRVASLFFSFFNILARVWAWRSAEGGSYSYTTACCWFGLVLRPFLKSFTHLCPQGGDMYEEWGDEWKQVFAFSSAMLPPEGLKVGGFLHTYIFIFILDLVRSLLSLNSKIF